MVSYVILKRFHLWCMMQYWVLLSICNLRLMVDKWRRTILCWTSQFFLLFHSHPVTVLMQSNSQTNLLFFHKSKNKNVGGKRQLKSTFHKNAHLFVFESAPQKEIVNNIHLNVCFCKSNHLRKNISHMQVLHFIPFSSSLNKNMSGWWVKRYKKDRMHCVNWHITNRNIFTLWSRWTRYVPFPGSPSWTMLATKL